MAMRDRIQTKLRMRGLAGEGEEGTGDAVRTARDMAGACWWAGDQEVMVGRRLGNDGGQAIRR